MKKLTHCLQLIITVIAIFVSLPTAASEQKDIESVTILADSRLAVPFSQLASRFSHESMISISGAFGVSADQKKKIEDGETADLFITSDMSLIQQLKVKGMVDVYSIGRIASHHDEHFIAAVVASENMTPARNFLAFLKSDEAKDIFKKNGLSVP
jgi:ABC-type molybdate transport system substrate-binding protein